MKAKKLLSVLLALLMVLTTIPFAYAANGDLETGVVNENISFTFDNETGKLSFYGTGEIEGGSVLNRPWSGYGKKTKILEFGEGITAIGHSTFQGYSSLVQIIFPETLEEIKGEAFRYCTALKSVKFPSSLRSIYYEAFADCTALENVEFNYGLTNIMFLAFMNCPSLKKIVLPRTMGSVGDHAFFNSALEEVIDLSGKTYYAERHSVGYCKDDTGEDDYSYDRYIGKCAKSKDFVLKGYEGSNAEKYAKENGIDFEDIPNEYKYYCGENARYSFDEETATLTISGSGKMYDYNSSTLPEWRDCYENGSYYNYYIRNLVIEEGITSIGKEAFKNCVYLESVQLPSTLERIEDKAFCGCVNLEAIVFPESLSQIGSMSFSDCYSLKKIVVPDNVKYIGDSAFSGCAMMEKVTLGKGVTKISEGMFAACFSLKEIEYNSEIEEISAEAFGFTLSLETIEIPETVKLIGENAFSNSLASDIIIYSDDVVLGQNSIGYIYADSEFLKDYRSVAIKYFNIEKQMSIAKHNGEIEKANELQQELDNLEIELFGIYNEDEVFFEEPVPYPITIHGYENSTAQTYAVENGFDFVTITETATSGQCGDNAYWEYDTETRTLTISGSGAMWDCEFEIIDHVGYNNRGWDMYKYKTKHIVIGDEIKRIGNYSFEDMLSVKTVYIGNSVESIGKYAFRSMLFLEKAVIPENVKTIEDYAFENSVYTEIILNDTVEVIGNGAFSECYKKMMTIPSTVKEIGTENFMDFSDNSHIVNKSTSITVIDENKIKYIQYIPETYFEKIIFMYDYSLSKTDAFSFGDENEDEELTKEFLAICNEKYGMTFKNIEEFIDSAEEGSFKGEEVLSHLTIECLEDSAQHEQCKKLGIKHSIIGSTCDDACGKHNVYTNDIMEPTCTENGYKGGKVCLDCEKVFEAATVIPATGHTPIITEGLRPTCTEIGFEDALVCDVCGELLEDLKLIQATGHTDKNNDGICDSCGEVYEDFEPEPIPETFGQRIINFFKGIVDSILALFRKLFG